MNEVWEEKKEDVPENLFETGYGDLMDDSEIFAKDVEEDVDLKNKHYKSVLHNYLTENNFPFEQDRKRGFSV